MNDSPSDHPTDAMPPDHSRDRSKEEAPRQNQAAQESLRAFLEQKLITRTVVSDSMKPTFVPGDRIRISQRSTSPRVGEIWAFWEPKKTVLIVHRVLATKEHGRWVLTKGDNRWHADGWIPHQAFLGQVIQVLKSGNNHDDAWEDIFPLGGTHFERAQGIFRGGCLGAICAFFRSASRRALRSRPPAK